MPSGQLIWGSGEGHALVLVAYGDKIRPRYSERRACTFLIEQQQQGVFSVCMKKCVDRYRLELLETYFDLFAAVLRFQVPNATNCIEAEPT